jgi:hypothetical protein
MAYKSTGRPVGRPKTKEYVTLLARVPADLAELVKKYADQHRLSVATVLREGAAWRIGDGDPRGMGLYLEESTDTIEKTYYANTETASEAESSAVLADMQAALARQEAQIQALTQMLEQQTALLRSHVYSSNTAIETKKQEPVVEQMSGGQNGQIDNVLDYDPTKRVLGKLCKRGHEWGHTGQSLLSKRNNGCLECEAEDARERRKRKREAQPVSG